MKKIIISVLSFLFLWGCATVQPTHNKRNTGHSEADQILQSQFKNHPQYAKYLKFINAARKVPASDLPLADGYIGEGQVWQTPYYLKESGSTGPTVLIIGGTHGYEIAGWQAAQELLKFKPDVGRLYVIPRINLRGVELRHRFVPGEKDLNRCYPGKVKGGNTERLAFDVFEFIKNQGVKIVFDLHESWDYHLVNEARLGQSVILYPDDTAAWASLMATETINETISEPLEKISFLQGPIKGSTAWAVGKILGIQGYTLETAIPLPLKKRIDYQVQLVRLILMENGINIVDKRN